MTTEATIQAHKLRTVGKMIARLAQVNLYAIQADMDRYVLFGTAGNDLNDSGMITAAARNPEWTVDQLMQLLAQIEEHGRPTPYYIKVRNETTIKGDVVPVPAGRIPMDVAESYALSIGGMVVECWRKE